jgi:hypothetical protein
MSVAQIVSDLCVQVNELEEIRRQGFLDWLNKHHHAEQPPQKETLLVFLYAWLADLDQDGLQWEVRLLFDEIAWWRNLSPSRLWRFLNKESNE